MPSSLITGFMPAQNGYSVAGVKGSPSMWVGVKKPETGQMLQEMAGRNKPARPTSQHSRCSAGEEPA